MATANIDVGYRPIRVALLVHENSMDDLLDAVRLNTLVWGGMTNPIIPVGDDLDAATSLVAEFSVDVLHPVADDPQLAEVVARFPHLRQPRELSIHGIFDSVGDDELGLVTIRLLASHYYETFVRFGAGKSSAAWPNWSVEDELLPLWTVFFGDYGDSPPARRCWRAFLAIEAEEIRIEATLPVEVLGRATPIAFTADRLRRSPGWFEGHGLVIGDPTDPTHLLRYWNLRSTGARVAFWPISGVERTQEFCLEHLKSVIPAPRPDGQPTIGPFLWRPDGWPRGERVSELIPEPISALIAEVEARPTLADLDDETWRQPLHRPAVWTARARRVLANVEDDQWENRKMVFPLPPHPFDDGRDEGFWRSHWLTTLSTTGEYNYPGYTIRLPSIPELNEWASRAITVIGDVRLADGAVGVVTEPKDSSLEINLVEEAEVVRQIVAHAGIDVEISPAGRAVARIIEQLGGLLGCRPFRLPGVRSLLARSPATHSWLDAVRTIEDQGSYRAYTNVGTAAETFQRLLERGVFQAGLHIKCPACTIRSRYLPEALGTDVRCPRCGTAFLLAPKLNDAHWEYQASGFFAHHREHGAIPVILTMLRLDHDVRERALFVAPSHKLSWEGFECEADFLALSQRHDGSVVVALGECKGGPEEIDADDLRKLKAVADRVRATDIECYLVFGTTRDSFSEREVEAFRAYGREIEGEWSLDERGQGWPRAAPLLLTWHELRSFDPYPRSLREQLPERYPNSFRELSANSAFLYSTEREGVAVVWDDEDLHI